MHCPCHLAHGRGRSSWRRHVRSPTKGEIRCLQLKERYQFSRVNPGPQRRSCQLFRPELHLLAPWRQYLPCGRSARRIGRRPRLWGPSSQGPTSTSEAEPAWCSELARRSIAATVTTRRQRQLVATARRRRSPRRGVPPKRSLSITASTPRIAPSAFFTIGIPPPPAQMTKVPARTRSLIALIS